MADSDPLAAWQARHGATSSPPPSYGDPAAEYAALREGAAVWVRAGWEVLRLSGGDPVEFLHKYVTQEVRRRPGQGAYGCVLTLKGGLVCDAWLLVGEGEVLALLPPGASEPARAHLRKYALLARVKLEPTAQVVVSVWGPAAAARCAAVLGSLPPLDEELDHAPVEVDGAPLRVVRDGAFGAPGYDLLVPAERAPALLDALVAAGARPVGAEAIEQVRVEAGVPLFGVDMDESTIPIEAGLEARAISYTKGCYLGQEVIARIAHRGRVNRHLRGLRFVGECDVPAPLFLGEKEVGQLTSLVRSPRLGGAALGLGLVHRKGLEPGAALRVGGPEGPAVEPCELPLAET